MQVEHKDTFTEDCMTPGKIERLNAGTFAHWEFGEWPIDRKKGLRYGQAFLNRFYPKVVHPELYYCQTVSEAKAIIAKVYLTA